MAFFLLILLLCLLNLGSVVRAIPASPHPGEKPTLVVAIAVPEEEGQRVVRLSTADPHIDVVIRNISSQPLDFYAEDCSEGYNTLHLEILGIDDKTLPKPIVVERNVSSWYSNSIRTVTLEPGAVMVREVHFAADHSFMGHPYWNFPAMNAGEAHKIRMRAIFEFSSNNQFQQSAKANTKHLTSLMTSYKTEYQLISPHPWTGRVSSAPNDYQVQQYSP